MWKKFISEVGIYKRKQEGKKTRKHAFDQDSNQEKKKNRKKTRSRPRSDHKQKKIFFSCFVFSPQFIYAASL